MFEYHPRLHSQDRDSEALSIQLYQKFNLYIREGVDRPQTDPPYHTILNVKD